jgi:DNA repair exonuclease SbcCD ATPase subunit
LRTTYKVFKTDEWDDEISKAEKNKDEAEKKRRDADKKDRKKYEALEDKSEEELREVKEDKQEWLKDFGNIVPVNPPPEFTELKNKIYKYYNFIIKYTDPLSETDLEELEKYKKNLDRFLNEPSYPCYVVDQQSEKPVLIIK